MVPFMDVNNMNEYDMVNPAESKGPGMLVSVRLDAFLKRNDFEKPLRMAGNQLMDAGRIHFVPESKLDISHSMGFRPFWQDEVFSIVITIVFSQGRFSFFSYDLFAAQEHGHLLCCTYIAWRTGQL